MGIKKSKLKFVKNMSDIDSDELVYMNYDVDKEFGLAFSKKHHIGEVNEIS